MTYKVKILETEKITHDCKRFVTEKPENYSFVSGQATMISVDKNGWRNEKRPFAFTSLNEDPFLEFTIKEYPEHKGVSQQIHMLKKGDKLIIGEPFGAIRYKGKGVFIAGGVGIAPFISIFRRLRKDGKLDDNKLIFSNKTSKDVILKKELKETFGENNLLLTLTGEEKKGYEFGRIDKNFLKKYINDFSQNFYICGPPKFVESMKQSLKELGAEPDNLIY